MTPALLKAWQKEHARLRPTLLTPDAVEWGDGPNPDLFWVPEDLTPLWNTKAYARLSQDQRLAYNQFYAQQLAEEFRWVETALISAPLKGVHQGWRDDGAVRSVLASFIDDEAQHIACFDRLISSAAMVNGSHRTFLEPPLILRCLATAAAAAPMAFAFWVNVIETFETYALAVGQSYRDATDIDPLFQSVFIVHARDEARHCQYDSLLVQMLVENQAGWKKGLAIRLSQLFMDHYYSPAWGMDGPVRALISRFPDLADQREAFKEDAALPEQGRPRLSRSQN